LYRKYDFEIVSRRKRYYTDNNEDAYIMTTPPFETAGFQTNLNRRRRQLHARLRARGTSSTPQSNTPGLTQDGQAMPAREQRAG
jgi:ribosomal-protein-alanine N-acetyltransferase